jgi:hypothetical protein
MNTSPPGRVYPPTVNAGGCTKVASLAGVTPGKIGAYGGQVASNVVQVQTADVFDSGADRTFQPIDGC